MKKVTHKPNYKFALVLFILLANCWLPINTCLAQAPQALNYQAVARDATGNILANQVATVRYTIHDATAGGTVLFQETQAVTTNQFGLFTASIGNGTLVTGDFTTINWSLNTKYLQVELNLGAGFVDMGTAQLLSVPYALNSLNTDGINGTVNYVPKFNTDKTLANSTLYDAGGLVGIGTALPTAHLTIDDNGSGSSCLYVHKTGTSENANFTKDNPNSNTPNVLMTYNNINGYPTLESHATADGVAGYFVADANGVGLQAQSNGLGTAASIFSNGGGGALAVSSNNTALASSFTQLGTGTAGYFNAPNGGKALLVNSGKVGIGTLTPTSLVDVVDAGNSSPTININSSGGTGTSLQALSDGYFGIDVTCSRNTGTGIQGTCNTGANAWGIAGVSDGGIAGYFSTTTGVAGSFNGNINGSGTFNYTSDAKLKKNIQPLIGALDKIMLLKPSTYEYRVGEFGSMTLAKGSHFGVIAQDLQKVFPELVSEQKYPGQKDKKTGEAVGSVDYLSVNYNELIPILIKGIQEQQATISELKAEVQALKMQVKK